MNKLFYLLFLFTIVFGEINSNLKTEEGSSSQENEDGMSSKGKNALIGISVGIAVVIADILAIVGINIYDKYFSKK